MGEEMNIEVKGIRRMTVPMARGTMIATYRASIGEFNIHRGVLLVNDLGAFVVTTGNAGGITLPADSETRRQLSDAVLAAYEELPND